MPTKPVPLRPLGTNGPLVPTLGFGLMNMAIDMYGKVPSDEERFVLLDRAVELGATFWDTSDLYGDSEELLGKWFRRSGQRDRIFLASKFGLLKNTRTAEANSSAAYCKTSCAASLERLGVASIDLYYLHSPNPETPIEETMRALAELKAEGKIKYIGLSNVSSATLRRAVKIAPVAAVQTEYSLFTRHIEGAAGTDLLATCRELGVALVASSPLSRGVMTPTFGRGESVGDATDLRPKVMPRLHEDNRAHNVDVITRLAALGAAKKTNPPGSVSQLTLAWLLRQGPDIFPVPGTKQLKYLEDNWRALDVELTDADDAEIRAFSEAEDLAGGVLPPQYEAFMYGDTKEES